MSGNTFVNRPPFPLKEHRPDVAGNLRFSFSVTTVTNSGNLQLSDWCNAITVINVGATVAHVNGYPVKPPLAPNLSGESFTIGGHAGEICKAKIQVQLDVTDPGAAVIVIEKFYLP